MSYKYIHGRKQVRRSRFPLFTACLTILFVSLLIAKHFYSKPQTIAPKQAHVYAAGTLANMQITNTNYALPTRLQIPKLQVDTQVKYVGVTKEGNMNMPSTVYDVGWYKYGALPGNKGTAVIAGHVDGLRGQPGVFRDLTKLIKGDPITVTESNGLTINFIVRETRNYPENAQPDEVFNSTTGSHLNLITCTGNWDSSGHSFTQRLVVFADKTL